MNDIKIKFTSSPHITIDGDSDKYLIEYYEMVDNKEVFKVSTILDNHHFYQIYEKEFYTDWLIKIYTWDFELKKIYEHRYNDENQNVRINLDTDNIDEYKLWYEDALEYQKLHNCRLIVSGKLNDHIDKKEHISYLNRDDQFPGVYKIYNIGRYDISGKFFQERHPSGYGHFVFNNLYQKTYKTYMNPRDWTKCSPKDISRDILGLNKLPVFAHL